MSRVTVFLKINGENVDLDVTESVRLRKRVVDATDINKRFGDFSYSINIPMTVNNYRVFATIVHPQSLNRFTTSKKVATRANTLNAEIYANNDIIISGELSIQEINPYTKNIKAHIVSGVGTLSKLFGEKKITELEWDPNNYLVGYRFYENLGDVLPDGFTNNPKNIYLDNIKNETSYLESVFDYTTDDLLIPMHTCKNKYPLNHEPFLYDNIISTQTLNTLRSTINHFPDISLNLYKNLNEYNYNHSGQTVYVSETNIEQQKVFAPKNIRFDGVDLYTFDGSSFILTTPETSDGLKFIIDGLKDSSGNVINIFQQNIVIEPNENLDGWQFTTSPYESINAGEYQDIAFNQLTVFRKCFEDIGYTLKIKDKLTLETLQGFMESTENPKIPWGVWGKSAFLFDVDTRQGFDFVNSGDLNVGLSPGYEMIYCGSDNSSIPDYSFDNTQRLKPYPISGGVIYQNLFFDEEKKPDGGNTNPNETPNTSRTETRIPFSSTPTGNPYGGFSTKIPWVVQKFPVLYKVFPTQANVNSTYDNARNFDIKSPWDSVDLVDSVGTSSNPIKGDGIGWSYVAPVDGRYSFEININCDKITYYSIHDDFALNSTVNDFKDLLKYRSFLANTGTVLFIENDLSNFGELSTIYSNMSANDDFSLRLNNPDIIFNVPYFSGASKFANNVSKITQDVNRNVSFSNNFTSLNESLSFYGTNNNFADYENNSSGLDKFKQSYTVEFNLEAGERVSLGQFGSGFEDNEVIRPRTADPNGNYHFVSANNLRYEVVVTPLQDSNGEAFTEKFEISDNLNDIQVKNYVSDFIKKNNLFFEIDENKKNITLYTADAFFNQSDNIIDLENSRLDYDSITISQLDRPDNINVEFNKLASSFVRELNLRQDLPQNNIFGYTGGELLTSEKIDSNIAFSNYFENYENITQLNNDNFNRVEYYNGYGKKVTNYYDWFYTYGSNIVNIYNPPDSFSYGYWAYITGNVGFEQDIIKLENINRKEVNNSKYYFAHQPYFNINIPNEYFYTMPVTRLVFQTSPEYTNSIGKTYRDCLKWRNVYLEDIEDTYNFKQFHTSESFNTNSKKRYVFWSNPDILTLEFPEYHASYYDDGGNKVYFDRTDLINIPDRVHFSNWDGFDDTPFLIKDITNYAQTISVPLNNGVFTYPTLLNTNVTISQLNDEYVVDNLPGEDPRRYFVQNYYFKNSPALLDLYNNLDMVDDSETTLAWLINHVLYASDFQTKQGEVWEMECKLSNAEYKNLKLNSKVKIKDDIFTFLQLDGFDPRGINSGKLQLLRFYDDD